METKGSMKEQEQLLELIRNFKFGMYTTLNAGGGMHVRPMAIAEVEQDCTVWLVTAQPSGKVVETQMSPVVSLSFQHDSNVNVVLYGTAEVLRDHTKAREIWSESFRPWFPGGPDDPTLALIRVSPSSGEYWDNSGINMARYAYEFARSYLTGEKAHVADGEQHGKVALR